MATRRPTGPDAPIPATSPYGRRRLLPLSWADLGLAGADVAWHDHAACNDPEVDPDVFFPEPGPDLAHAVLEAKRICASCPVRAECQTYALEHDERHGIWGGHGARAREKARAHHRQHHITWEAA